MAVVINGTTGISGVAGSAGTPAYQGTDADSGFFINSANEPSASVNGSPVWNSASTFGFKNRIINGAMMIDQRNAGASVTVNGGTQFGVDRFFGEDDTDGVFTLQQSSVAPAGFTNSLLATITTADTSLGSAQLAIIGHRIEGFNMADLNWGSANAKTVTLSFWVRSSLTGTFGGALWNSAGDRSYPYSYTISAANTWEQKTITIAGDTTGTWLTNNGRGVSIGWSLGVGSSYQATAGSWVGALELSATGATSVIGTNGATFYITGVQLEVGTVATSFDYRPYGTEVVLCQRYYQKSFNFETAPAANISGGNQISLMNGQEPQITLPFAVNMRASPTVTLFNPYGGTAGQWSNATSSSANARAVATNNQHIGIDNTDVTLTGWVFAEIQWTASAEL